jgi:cyclic pyranopterin phosphate synthase
MDHKLNHFNAAGEAHMVDVGGKEVTSREAEASGRIRMQAHAFELVKEGTAAKGDVLGVARVAGIMAVKKTPELIPLAHSIPIEGCELTFTLHEDTCEVEAVCTVRAQARTGAEMEALTGVSAALLTVYDMVKAADRGMEIVNISLRRKNGGKSGVFARV